MRLKLKIICTLIIATSMFAGCGKSEDDNKGFGLFLSLDSESLDKIKEYRTLVIDAQYFNEQDIAELHKNSNEIYSYLNVGAIENFRDYYQQYADLALGKYKNWDEEEWIDVSSEKWQEFIIGLAKELIDKGVDGIFVDNCDVYYNFKNDEIFNGLSVILENLIALDTKVMINGGDEYVKEYYKRNNTITPIMTAVNQENVFTHYNFDKGTCEKQEADTHEYYLNYINNIKAWGGEVFITEYATDKKLIQEIRKESRKHGWNYYISDSIELD